MWDVRLCGGVVEMKNGCWKENEDKYVHYSLITFTEYLLPNNDSSNEDTLIILEFKTICLYVYVYSLGGDWEGEQGVV